MSPTAVLLAFDGVLADTENFHVAAWQRTFSRLGWDVPDAVAARSINCDDYTFAVEVFARRRVFEADVEGWVARKRALMLDLTRRSPRLFPGAAELVEALAGRVRLGLTAESRREVVDAVLGRFGLDGAFEFVIADDDVKSPRPNAARLAAAVKRLKRKRSWKGATVVVEGTPDGLRTARLAGISAVAVGHHHPAGDWIGDAPFVAGLKPVSDLLAQLGVSGGS